MSMYIYGHRNDGKFKDDIYMITVQGTQHCSLHSLNSVYKTSHISYICFVPQLTLQHAIHTKHHPLHAFNNPPMHTTNTRHCWQNGTRCKDGMKVLWCHSVQLRLAQFFFGASVHVCTRLGIPLHLSNYPNAELDYICN